MPRQSLAILFAGSRFTKVIWPQLQLLHIFMMVDWPSMNNHYERNWFYRCSLLSTLSKFLMPMMRRVKRFSPIPCCSSPWAPALAGNGILVCFTYTVWLLILKIAGSTATPLFVIKKVRMSFWSSDRTAEGSDIIETDTDWFREMGLSTLELIDRSLKLGAGQWLIAVFSLVIKRRNSVSYGN